MLALNLFLLAGCLALCVRARDLQRTQDADARLHESARLALAVLESDLRLAGYWGLAASADAAHAESAAGVSGPLRRQAVDHEHGPVRRRRQQSLPRRDQLRRRRWRRGRRRGRAGDPSRERPAPGADRRRGRRGRSRADPGGQPARCGRGLPAGHARRPGAPGYDYTPVASAAPAAELRALLVHAYYVSVDSSLARGYPALRRKTLTSGPAVGDEEIAAGIEDLQFRVHFDTDGDGSADVTADPDAGPDGATAVAVQVWLRLRSQERDHALGSIAADAYADRAWPARTTTSAACW